MLENADMREMVPGLREEHFAQRDVPVSWFRAYCSRAAGQTGSAETFPPEPSPFGHLKSNKEQIQ